MLARALLSTASDICQWVPTTFGRNWMIWTSMTCTSCLIGHCAREIWVKEVMRTGNRARYDLNQLHFILLGFLEKQLYANNPQITAAQKTNTTYSSNSTWLMLQSNWKLCTSHPWNPGMPPIHSGIDRPLKRLKIFEDISFTLCCFKFTDRKLYNVKYLMLYEV